MNIKARKMLERIWEAANRELDSRQKDILIGGTKDDEFEPLPAPPEDKDNE